MLIKKAYIMNLAYVHLLFSSILIFKCITGRLEGILLEAKGSWAEAEKAYSSLLEDNPLDPVNSVTYYL